MSRKIAKVDHTGRENIADEGHGCMVLPRLIVTQGVHLKHTRNQSFMLVLGGGKRPRGDCWRETPDPGDLQEPVVGSCL